MNTKPINENDFRIIYKMSNGFFRIYDNYNDTFKTAKYPTDNYKFYIIKSLDENNNNIYPTTDEGLKKYSHDFKIMSQEISEITKKKSKKGTTIFNYCESYCDFTSVIRFFNSKAKNQYMNHQKIEPIEDKWWSLCNNGFLQYLKKNDTTYECYGYDKIKFYPSILNSEYMIPTKPGKEYFITKLENSKGQIILKPGFYKCKITCASDDFRKLFSFSENNVYNDESLNQALLYRDQFNVKIELIIDDEPNCYLYNKKDMVTMKSIFSGWYETLIHIEKECKNNRLKDPSLPKNVLVKFLSSSLHGHLSRKNIITKTRDEMKIEKLNVGIDSKSDYTIVDWVVKDNTEYYELLKSDEIYKHPIRLKPWLSAISRNVISEYVIKDINNVVRIMCDNVVYDKPMIFDEKERFIIEKKTTGLIHFKNNYRYEKV